MTTVATRFRIGATARLKEYVRKTLSFGGTSQMESTEPKSTHSREQEVLEHLGRMLQESPGTDNTVVRRLVASILNVKPTDPFVDEALEALKELAAPEREEAS